MTAQVVGIHCDYEAAMRRQSAYFKAGRPGPLTDAERSLAAQYLAYKAVFGEPLTPEDKLILAVRIADETVADRWHDLFRALVWELAGPACGPRLALALDDLVHGTRR